MATVTIDDDTLVDMLIDRLDYWTDDKDTKEVYRQYYEHMVSAGCFSGAEFDVMVIVDNDYINNLSIITREEYEEERAEYIKEQMKDDGYEDEEVTEEEYSQVKEEYENDIPTWENLECGENNLEFLSGYYIEAKTCNVMLMS